MMAQKEGKRIIFRADGNPQIGAGHVMRCLSLAEAFRRIEFECLFVMASDDFKEIVEQRGFASIILNRDFRDMDGEIDLLESVLQRYLGKAEWPCLFVVDSYYVSEGYFQKLRSDGFHVCYVDDLGEHAFPIDILLNYNVYGPDIDYASSYLEKRMTVPQLFLGIAYAPLRSEYQNIPRRVIRNSCQKVLISSGGTDPVHLSKHLVEYLISMDLKTELQFHFLLTRMNPDREELLKKKVNPNYIVFHDNLSCLKDIILECDIALSASGSTLYELCACGLPTINYVLADNQIAGCKKFFEMGLMDSIGDLRGREREIGELAYQAIIHLSNDKQKRCQMSKKMQEMVDGNGADHFALELLRHGFL